MVVPSPSPAVVPTVAKAALRDSMRDRRHAFAQGLGADTRAAMEGQLADALESLVFAARVVAGYFPMRDEIDVQLALSRAQGMGKTCALPSFLDRDAPMTFRAGPPLENGPWGIRQPATSGAMLSPDLLLIPLLAIDRAGNRVGMGKGHYDRALPGLLAAGARLIGVGWDFQLIDGLIVADPWDVPLHGFASPSGLQEFSR